MLIPASGELSALNQTEITNKLEARAVITEVVPEGTLVRKGDVLLRFKDDEVRRFLKEAEEAVISAESALEASQADLEIKQRGRESAVAKAEVEVELATLAFNAWLEGESVSRREELEVAVRTAEKNYDRQQLRFESSKRLSERGFISEDQMRGDEIAFIEAQAQLNKSRRDVEVYDKYTYNKEHTEHESKLEQAQEELIRVRKSQDAEVHKAENAVFSSQRQLESQQQWQDKWTKQLENCTVTAPQDGLVVYASSLEEFSWMRYNNMSIQPGSEMYHNQLLMVLPDTSQMVATVKVNEAISGSVQTGQPATVVCDAAPGRIMHGTVESIGVLAESSRGFGDPNRKEYTVRIKLEGIGGFDLKPAMRCTADIEVNRIEDALHVPLQAVHHEGANHFVYVPIEGGCAQRKVTIGRASDLYIEIASGLEAGDPVLLIEPEADQIVERLEKGTGVPDDGELVATSDEPPSDSAAAGYAAPADTSAPPGEVLATPEVVGPMPAVESLPAPEATDPPVPAQDPNSESTADSPADTVNHDASR